ncbi:MAG: hypothetical protein Kow0058_14760 [Roseovarius sp.]
MLLFAIATTAPCGLIALAVLAGGGWAWAALGYMTLLTLVMDRLTGLTARAANADPQAEFPAATALLLGLGLGHFALMALAVRGAAGLAVPAAPAGLDPGARIALLVAAGLVFGQISHPVAHELIHRPRRELRLIGRLVYSSLLIGHHASAHLLVHHVHVGTDADPASAPRGMGFWRFAARAWRGGFLAGLAAENRRRAASGRALRRHPYALYLAAGALTLLAGAAIGGRMGVAALVVMAAHAQLQILMSDYVQHYGLRRRRRADGRLEPVGPGHSWNAPHRFSAAMMLNAPRHSDHHVTPSRPFPALQLDARAMPCLPRPLPVMAALALLPPLWFRVMDRRCARWPAGRESGWP